MIERAIAQAPLARSEGVGRPRICLVASCGFTVKAFLLKQIAALAESYTVDLVVGRSSPELLSGIPPSVKIFQLPIARPVSPYWDVHCVMALWMLLRNGGYSAIHSVTPKGGLLMALAGSLAGIPVRIHTFTGQVWATRTGAGRVVLKLVDRLIAALATHILVDSSSQLEFLVRERVLRRGKGLVLGDGSICGVDLGRFQPDNARRAQVRSELGIAKESFVILFVGRLKLDKGVLDLARAFASVAREGAVHLVLVGPDEDALRQRILGLCGEFADRVRIVSFTDAPEAYMAAADVLCLPSYREGFGNVIIEAAACGVPAVASDVYGITDAVVADATGILHPPGNVGRLTRALLSLFRDGSLRARLGAASRERAHRSFGSQRLTDELLQFYVATVGDALPGGDSRA